ncbi:MAG: FAD-dependent oxidoreductase [Acidobacteriaceae bacterium]|nr:FAD-dependent oxidoreductase [Acidobacteriaceae bacterium]
MTERETLTATLLHKLLLSQETQTFHLELAVDEDFSFTPGQFISVLQQRMLPPGHPRAGEMRTETRAYSLASAPREGRIELCVNRVQADPGGFFSNLLCDMELGATLEFHGPHGNFMLRGVSGPVLFLAEETGIAPVRSMLQASPQLQAHLIQASSGAGAALYGSEFAALPALHYLPVVDDAEHAKSLAAVDEVLRQQPAIREAYIVGLSSFVNAHRTHLKELGWDRKQIVFERYD